MTNKLSFVLNGMFYTKSNVSIPDGQSTEAYLEEVIEKIKSIHDGKLEMVLLQQGELFYYGYELDKIKGSVIEQLFGCTRETLDEIMVDPEFILMHDTNEASGEKFNKIELYDYLPELYNFLPMTTEAKIKGFLRLLIVDLRISIHPDDNFENYLDENGNLNIRGKFVQFSDMDCSFMDNLMGRAFEIAGDKLYDWCFEMTQVVLPGLGADLKKDTEPENIIPYELADASCDVYMAWRNLASTLIEGESSLSEAVSNGDYPFASSFDELEFQEWSENLCNNSVITFEGYVGAYQLPSVGFVSDLEAFGNAVGKFMGMMEKLPTDIDNDKLYEIVAHTDGASPFDGISFDEADDKVQTWVASSLASYDELEGGGISSAVEKHYSNYQPNPNIISDELATAVGEVYTTWKKLVEAYSDETLSSNLIVDAFAKNYPFKLSFNEMEVYEWADFVCENSNIPLMKYGSKYLGIDWTDCLTDFGQAIAEFVEAFQVDENTLGVEANDIYAIVFHNIDPFGGIAVGELSEKVSAWVTSVLETYNKTMPMTWSYNDDEDQFTSRHDYLVKIITALLGKPMNSYSGSADWGGLSVWTVGGNNFEGAFIIIDDNDDVVLLNRKMDEDGGEDRTLATIDGEDERGVKNMLDQIATKKEYLGYKFDENGLVSDDLSTILDDDTNPNWELIEKIKAFVPHVCYFEYKEEFDSENQNELRFMAGKVDDPEYGEQDKTVAIGVVNQINDEFGSSTVRARYDVIDGFNYIVVDLAYDDTNLDEELAIVTATEADKTVEIKKMADEIKAFIKQNSWFELEEVDAISNELRYTTRDHGDVGEETAGLPDIVEARRICGWIKDNYFDNGVTAYYETVDEWVDINIEFPRV